MGGPVGDSKNLPFHLLSSACLPVAGPRDKELGSQNPIHAIHHSVDNACKMNQVAKLQRSNQKKIDELRRIRGVMDWKGSSVSDSKTCYVLDLA